MALTREEKKAECNQWALGAKEHLRDGDTHSLHAKRLMAYIRQAISASYW